MAGTEESLLVLCSSDGAVMRRRRGFVAGLDLEMAPGGIRVCGLRPLATGANSTDLWKVWWQHDWRWVCLAIAGCCWNTRRDPSSSDRFKLVAPLILSANLVISPVWHEYD